MLESKNEAVKSWKALADALRESAISAGFSETPDEHPKGHMEQYDGLILDEDIRNVSRELFRDGHYTQAVQESYKFLDSFVRSKVRNKVKSSDTVCATDAEGFWS